MCVYIYIYKFKTTTDFTLIIFFILNNFNYILEFIDFIK